MADDNSRALQAMIDEAANIVPSASEDESSDAFETTDESEMDYEPTSEDDDEIRHAFLEQLLASEEDDEEDEDEEEDDDGMASVPLNRRRS